MEPFTIAVAAVQAGVVVAAVAVSHGRLSEKVKNLDQKVAEVKDEIKEFTPRSECALMHDSLRREINGIVKRRDP